MSDREMDGDFLGKVNDLKFNFEGFKADLNESEDADRNELKAGYFAYLSDISSVVEEADQAKVENLGEIIGIADETFSSAVDFMDPFNHSRYGRLGSMQSFTHNDSTRPVLHESDGKRPKYTSHRFYHGTALPMLEFFGNTNFFDISRKNEALGSLKLPPSWVTTTRPDPLSTPCARFSDTCPDAIFTGMNDATAPMAASVTKAKCEITATPIPQPNKLTFSTNQKGIGTPILRCESLADPTLRCTFTVALATLTETAFDHDNSMIVAGDWERIKTYVLQPLEEGETKRKLLPVHTMTSQEYTGPITFLSSNRIARCGKGKLAIWNLDELPTHGEDGKQIIGSVIPDDKLNTFRMEEDVERSSGSLPHSVHSLPWEDRVIHKWHAHPSTPNTMLCSLNRESEQFKCHAIDLVDGGARPKARYLGHGGQIESFSTSKGDANLFVTSADDSYVRIYDQRHPLPVLTIRAGPVGTEALPCAALCRPDGLPYLFTSNDREEAIKLWDLRSNAFVYELATGNNVVIAMAWDDEANALSAITECCYERNEYRAAKFSPKQLAQQRAQAGSTEGEKEEDEGEDEEEDEEEDGEEDDDEGGNNEGNDDEGDDDEGDDDEEDEEEDPYKDYQEDTAHPHRKWPKKAYHAENYWGHVFDSRGLNKIYRYKFTPTPDLNAQPAW
ncbi:hypothetical protein BKA70DRAFT_1262418 [Coprinopsis sp. MPI-PUGE-AT-0042]|nr:hypothetical protein BKA70DRAFT_1262418 [Coprinopsis sp. MPI-PUGE-AT-0042]